jgi:recombination protein RecA
MAENKKKKTQIDETAVEAALNALGSGFKKKFRKACDYEQAETIPTKYPEINKAIGIIGPDGTTNSGGIPLGYVVELYGPEAGGKTNIALGVIGNAQNMGKLCALIDVEQAFNPDRAGQIGVDVDSLVVGDNFESGDDALESMETLIKTGRFSIVVLDSTAALIPKAEIEGNIGDVHVATLARLMSQATKKIMDACKKHKTTAIFINQIRENVGVMYGPTETTPGGKALKFYSSLRLKVASVGAGGKSTIVKNDEGEIIGGNSKAKVMKNRFAPPYNDCDFIIYYTDYTPSAIDKLFALGRKTDWAVEDKKGKIIAMRKGEYKFNDYMAEGDQVFKQGLFDVGMVEALYEAVYQSADDKEEVQILYSDLMQQLKEFEEQSPQTA